MLIKGITDEDLVNYKLPSMYIATATCSFKCDKEHGSPICQNGSLATQPSIDISITSLILRYLENHITKAVVFGGLEPFDQLGDLIDFIRLFRGIDYYARHDDIVIYTGYTKEELFGGRFDSYFYKGMNLHGFLSLYKDIIVKFGRYIPGQEPHLDPVLGVMLASDNQFAERIRL